MTSLRSDKVPKPRAERPSLSASNSKSARRKQKRRKGGNLNCSDLGKDVAWAARQGESDRKAGTSCRRYKNFLRNYNLPRSEFTFRMWNAYLPASPPTKPVRRNASPSKRKHASHWTRGLTLGDMPAPRRETVRRYDRVMPRASDLSPENVALLKKVNQLDTLVDMWR
jgi:hypothetical protein